MAHFERGSVQPLLKAVGVVFDEDFALNREGLSFNLFKSFPLCHRLWYCWREVRDINYPFSLTWLLIEVKIVSRQSRIALRQVQMLALVRVLHGRFKVLF